VSAKPLNLLVVGVRWPPETFIQRKLEGLAAHGIKVTVATSVPWSKAKPQLQGVGFRRLYHSDDPPVLSCLRLVWIAMSVVFHSPQQLLKVFEVVRNQHLPLKSVFAKLQAYLALVLMRREVVHFEWNSAAIDFLPMFDLWDCPVVISCRGSQINVRPHVPGNEQFNAGLAESFQKARAVHCVSAAIRNEAAKYGLEPTKAWIIRPAVDPVLFHPSVKARSDAGIFRVITTGSLIWLKGYEYALQAIRAIVDQGVPLRFDIIGEGPERQRVLYTIYELGLGEHVRLFERLTSDEVRQQLQDADVFLLSSLSEGISNAVLEAMACGLPIVSSDCGGMREAITHGVEGFLVPSRDQNRIAECLKKLYEDADLRKRMGRAARKRAQSEFSLEQQIARFIDLYDSLNQMKTAR
jgi:glycosyltransferase involved in cell wall biosynthesis